MSTSMDIDPFKSQILTQSSLGNFKITQTKPGELKVNFENLHKEFDYEIVKALLEENGKMGEKELKSLKNCKAQLLGFSNINTDKQHPAMVSARKIKFGLMKLIHSLKSINKQSNPEVNLAKERRYLMEHLPAKDVLIHMQNHFDDWKESPAIMLAFVRETINSSDTEIISESGKVLDKLFYDVDANDETKSEALSLQKIMGLDQESIMANIPAQSTAQPTETDGQPAPPTETVGQPVRIETSTVDENAGKRAAINMLMLDLNPSLASTSVSSISNLTKLDIPTMIEELPRLYPEVSSEKLGEMRRTLTTAWMKLDAGHEWGIGLSLTVGSKVVNLEGSRSSHTTRKAVNLFTDFMTKEGDSVKGQLSPSGQKRVEQAALSGANASRMSSLNYKLSSGKGLADPRENLSAGRALKKDLDDKGIITIPTGWSNHAVGITIHQARDGKCYLYYCNRGGRAFEKAEDRALMGGQEKTVNMVCFEIGDPSVLTPEFLGQIAGAAYHDPNPTITDQFAKSFIEGSGGIFQMLKLEKVAEIAKTPQKVGNCAWSNCKGSIHAATIAAAYDELFTSETDRATLFNQAISAGGNVFKQMERFGRKQGLVPLLKYNALAPESDISPFDHLRVLSAAGRKLTKKMAEEGKSTHSTDQEMFLQVQVNLNNCQYPLSECSHLKLSELGDLDLKSALNSSGSGSYAFVGNECWVNNNGKIEVFPAETSQTLSSFLAEFQTQHPNISLTIPVFLDQRGYNYTEDQIKSVEACRVAIGGMINVPMQLSSPNAQSQSDYKEKLQDLQDKISKLTTSIRNIPDGNPPSQSIAKLKDSARSLQLLLQNGVQPEALKSIQIILVRLNDTMIDLD